jgi:hypothetical protein
MSAEDDKVRLALSGCGNDFFCRCTATNQNVFNQIAPQMLSGKSGQTQAVPMHLYIIGDFTVHRPVATIDAELDGRCNVEQ